MDPSVADQQDEYGSDFSPDEEEIINGLLQAPREPNNPITDSDLLLNDVEDEKTPRGTIVRRLGCEQRLLLSPATEKRRVTIQVDGNGDNPADIESATSRAERQRSVSIEAPLDPKPEAPDLRSPLERFRTKPKKAFSVTDLISPSWCELQYWYVLTKHGKKRSTPAMRQGSAVHKILEDQVHQTVAVTITSIEDAWGLRIWNIIQGLKTLQETGMTRELEIWGTVDGLVVNGVIDELSFTCPDRGLEEAEEKGKTIKALPADQTTITDFLGGSTLENDGQGAFKNNYASLQKTPKIYITDVKTRGIKSIPKGASFRPTLMQLMIYHRLLSDLATNKVDADRVFDRYELKPDAQFSDSFIAQIGSLNETIYEVPSSSETDAFASSQDSMTVLLSHNSLRSLWTLMISQFAQTIPAGVRSIGNILRAEYRNATDGEIMGEKTFLYDEKTLQEYLDDEMRWWKGEREAQGVCVEEAYKCGYCEFADECSWRKNKIVDATEKMRRTRSAV